MASSFSTMIACMLFGTCALGWDIGQRVPTFSGLIDGHAADFSNQVSEYLGIPYAAPPVGNLRFAAPQSWNGVPGQVFRADKFSADCAQNLPGDQFHSDDPDSVMAKVMAATAQAGHTVSEDCLTLNIWTKPQTGDRAKAVLFWIPGGGFMVGTSNLPTVNGARLAGEQDVIVVTMNYRLNIFGFPTDPSSIVSPNAGLLDQRMALKWVEQNIAAFGGDPKRITIVGESAGASSVQHYSYAYTKDPVINGMIIQSGSDFWTKPKTNSSAWFAVSKLLGCGDDASKGDATVACMRQKPMKDVLKAVWDSGNDPKQPAGFRINFGPYIDDVSVFGDYAARTSAGNYIKKPAVVGCDDNEGGFTSALAQLIGKPALSEYELQIIENGYNCAAADTASRFVAVKVPAFRYRYFGDFPNQRVMPGVGAYHSSEIPLIFGTSKWMTGLEDTPSEIALSNTMMKSWATFAKDPQNGLTKLGWPAYIANKPSLAQFGFHNETSYNIAQGNKYDSWC